MSDEETVRVYDAKANDYVKLTDPDQDGDPNLAAFIADCGPQARVLDLGCGPGHAAAEMARAGLIAIATDASPEMVALASRHENVDARCATFDDLAEVEAYDGVWASFSLLHAPRHKMAMHLAQIRRALRPGGVFHIGTKLGTGEARDNLGRFYTYYEADELGRLLTAAGFTESSRSFGSSVGLDGVMADWIWIAARA